MPRTFRKLPLMLLLAFLAGTLAGCGGEDTAPPENPSPAVEALPARRGTLPLEERLNGVVRADNQIAVQAEIEAPVLEVLVRNGEAVRKGQPLVRLNGDTLRDQLRQAEASVRLAAAAAAGARARMAEVEAQVVRTRALAREELVSQLELETREAQLSAARASAEEEAARVEQARATVQERRTALDRTVIRAPVDGRVGQRNAEVGMLAGPGDVLFLLGDMSDLVVEIPLTEEMLGRIRAGQPVSISSPAFPGTISAALSRVSPFLEEASFSTTGEIDVEQGDQGRLRPGMFVTVDVLYGQSEQATLVPASALWEDPRTGIRGVFVVDAAGMADTSGPAGTSGTSSIPETPRKVELRPIEVLAEGRAQIGVSGVEPGEWVVVVGQHLLAQDSGGPGGAESAESAGSAGITARVRATTWERVLGLQDLQREDLLQSFLDKQQRLARSRGAEPPTSEEFMGSAGSGTPGKEGG